MKNIIKMENVIYKKLDKVILDLNKLDINQGEFLSIVGSAGAGKTSLINVLLNRVILDTGSIFVSNDCKIADISDINSFVFATNKVIDEIKFSLRKDGLSEEEINERINMIITSLHLNDVLEYIPSSLSTGQKILVSLASILVTYPDVLIVDECFNMLDGISKANVFNLIKKIKKERNMTIIYATQDVEDILYSDKVVLLSDGKIVLDSKMKDAFVDEKLYKSMGLSFPFMVDLSKKLQYYGLVDKVEFNMIKLVNKLWK